jgi:hypothetical protein
MSDKVQFQTNVPVDVALKYNDGKEVTGQYGDQVLYTLTDGRVMYVPPIVKKKIDELGIGRGELFTIRRREEERNTAPSNGWLRRLAAMKPQSRVHSRTASAVQRCAGRIDADKMKISG